MIPFVLVLHALNAALCCIGYVLVANGKHKRLGFVLGAVGSVGWLMVAPSLFFAAQSLVFLAGSVVGYERSKAR